MTDPTKVTPDATAGCEPATEQLRVTNANMLPGRICGNCHKAGGPAERSPFTISGTVFESANSPCNGGGRRNVIVEVKNAKENPPGSGNYVPGDVQPQGVIRAFANGNFFSAARFTTPMFVAVYDANDPNKREEMARPLGRDVDAEVNCAACHQFPGMKGAPGRIYLAP